MCVLNKVGVIVLFDSGIQTNEGSLIDIQITLEKHLSTESQLSVFSSSFDMGI